MSDPEAIPSQAVAALRYAEFFGADARNRLAEDLRHFYRDEDFRYFQERLEFSMVFGEDCAPQLRYVLYRIHSGQAVARWLDARGQTAHDARRLIEILGPVTPEFAVAVDRTPLRERVKFYFMRLVPEQGGETDLAARVLDAAGCMGVQSGFAPGLDLGKTGIFTVDYYNASKPREIKLYHWGLDRWRERAREAMGFLGIHSRFAESFFTFAIGSSGLDTLFCHRYAPGIPGPIGFAVHLPIRQDQKPSVEEMLRNLLPDVHAACWEPLRRAEALGGRLLVGYFGISFSLRPPAERLHLYFSVV